MAITERLTLDEFLLRPEAQPALEYERGVVSQKMSPSPRHGRVQGVLAIRFELHGRPDQPLVAFTETRVTWPDVGISYVPDVVVYRVERVPLDDDDETVADAFLVPPDIAVEIASPGQGERQQLDRCRWYVDHGVAVALYLDPRREIAWIVRPGSELGPLQGDDPIDLTDVADGLTFTAGELFASLRVRRR